MTKPPLFRTMDRICKPKEGRSWTAANLLKQAFALVLSLFHVVAVTAADAQTAGPIVGEAKYRDQEWWIPSSIPDHLMFSRLVVPPGEGPFPLAVISHGSEEDPRARVAHELPEYEVLVSFLSAMRYAIVIPQRPGHGNTGGPYLEAQGRCGAPDYVRAGFATATSIQAAIDFFSRQAFIKPAETIVIGHSAGGWGALALAATAPAGVRAVINFAGGRGGRDRGRPNFNCAPDRLVAASGRFGTTALIPTLWIYSSTDSYFAPDLSRRMADAFALAGGQVEYHLFENREGDGHGLVFGGRSQRLWQSVLAEFLGR